MGPKSRTPKLSNQPSVYTFPPVGGVVWNVPYSPEYLSCILAVGDAVYTRPTRSPWSGQTQVTGEDCPDPHTTSTLTSPLSELILIVILSDSS